MRQEKAILSFVKSTQQSQQKHSSNKTREDSTHGHYQMVNTEIRQIIFLVAKGGGEGNGTPLQYSRLENPMDGGAWQAAVHGVAEGQT